jgi:hypothetical protein
MLSLSGWGLKGQPLDGVNPFAMNANIRIMMIISASLIKNPNTEQGECGPGLTTALPARCWVKCWRLDVYQCHALWTYWLRLPPTKFKPLICLRRIRGRPHDRGTYRNLPSTIPCAGILVVHLASMGNPMTLFRIWTVSLLQTTVGNWFHPFPFVSAVVAQGRLIDKLHP